MLVQHLWMNRVDVKEIASRLRSTLANIQGYLSSRAIGPADSAVQVNASLRATLLHALPDKCDYVIRVQAYLAPRTETLVDIALDDGRGRRVAGLRRVGRGFRILASPPHLVRVLERLDSAAAAWCQKMEGKVRGLGAEISVDCYPETLRAQSATGSGIQVRPLMQPLRDALDRLWKKGSRQRYEGWDTRVAVTLAAKPVLTLEKGRGANADRRVIQGERAEAAITTARDLYRRFRSVLEGEHWVIYFRGDALVPEEEC
jgi:hypothetical protein